MSAGQGPDRPRPEAAEPLLARHEPSDRPWLVRVMVGDDALAPTLPIGSLALIDTTERELVDGELYALRSGETVELWVWCEGFAGRGRVIAGRPVGTLASLAEPPRWSGPVEPGRLAVVGRVVGVLGAGAAGEDPTLGLDHERTVLLERLTLARLELREIELDWHDRPQPFAGLDGLDPVELRQRVEALRADPAIAVRLDLERRIEALEGRIGRLEDLIAAAPAASLEGVRAKLQLVWSLHHAPFPGVEGDLERTAIGSALRALDALLGRGRDLGAVVEPPAAPSTVLQLVPSPRRRG